MRTLTLVSLMADNARLFYRSLAEYLCESTSADVRVVDDVSWQDREQLLYSGQADIAFLCGLQYVQRTDLQLLAAPVMQAARYGDRPIYFSDVVVRKESRFRSFEDLRGASWAYNEPTSHSGCNLVRYYLASMGEDARFFRRVVGSGAHQESLRLLAEGSIDATAIDSTVLEMELEQRPELAASIRVVHTLGPSPIPPVVARRSVPLELQEIIRRTLLQIHNTNDGRRVLDSGMLRRFALVVDADYDPIREMARQAGAVTFAEEGDDPSVELASASTSGRSCL